MEINSRVFEKSGLTITDTQKGRKGVNLKNWKYIMIKKSCEEISIIYTYQN